VHEPRLSVIIEKGSSALLSGNAADEATGYAKRVLDINVVTRRMVLPPVPVREIYHGSKSRNNYSIRN
jgi:hypothetical protein